MTQSAAAHSPPLRLLAIGTSTDWCTAALLVRDAQGIRVSACEERAGPSQSKRLMPMVGELIAGQHMTLDALDAVAFDAGPGAFTGLRIGCGTAQGLAFALGIPVVQVGSLEALALQSGADQVCCVIDARMGEVYVGAYQVAGEIPAPVGLLRVAPASDPAALLARWAAEGGGDPHAGVATGDAFIRHPALAEAFGQFGFRVQPVAFPGAEAIARVAAARFDAGQVMNARDVGPIYVRDKVALDVDEQQQLRAARAGNAGAAR